ncbi:MAG: hypothetical protein U0Y08_10255 [Bacteroidia bacterium]
MKLIMLIISLLILTQTGKNGTKVVLKENGLKYILNYRNDTLHGPYFIYLNEEILQTGDLNMGYRNGTVKLYKNNSLYIEKCYEKGKLITITNFNADGTYSYKRTFMNDKMFCIHYIDSTTIDSGWTKHNKKLYEGFIDSLEKLN